MTYPDELEASRGRRGFEALAVVLLSLATVGMAWCSYQASGWSTRSTKLSIQSAHRGRDAATFRIKANQGYLLDVFVFSEYVKALTASNDLLARFYYAKFSPELKQAHEVWMRTRPFENPDAPLNAFATNVYHIPLLERADAAEKQSQLLWYQSSSEAARTDHQYTLISVLLATALFFGAMAPRFEVRKKRIAVLVLGLAALLWAVGMFIRLPRTKEGWSVPAEIQPEFIKSQQ